MKIVKILTASRHFLGEAWHCRGRACPALVRNDFGKKTAFRNIRHVLLVAVFAVLIFNTAGGEESPAPPPGRTLPLDEFIQLAAAHDTEFESILITELTLQYQKALRLPAGDLVLSVKQQQEFYFDQDRDSPDTTVSLSKLFPVSGTETELAYHAGKSLNSSTTSSDVSFTLSQPVAQNAFGRSTRLLDKIVGLEVEVARHQVIEAYEDYMAVILTAYYDWYEAYENLNVGGSSYQSNLQLLDNIHERQKQKVALPIDVNKVKLQVMSKEERLIELEEQYQNSLNIIQRMIRYEGEEPLVPAEPRAMDVEIPDFDTFFAAYAADSRTFDILRKLEDRSQLQVGRDADDLLPSINLLIGYEVDGEKYSVDEEDNMLFAGVELEWPLGHQTERAEYEISKILDRRVRLTTTNTYYRIYTQMMNLHLQIEREKELMRIADERIELAKAILTDETENYSFGKVSLNDFIQAVNALDTNRFNKIAHEALYKKLLVEWLRLADRLVQDRDVPFQKSPGTENP